MLIGAMEWQAMTSCLCCTVTLVVDGATNESQAVKLNRTIITKATTRRTSQILTELLHYAMQLIN